MRRHLLIAVATLLLLQWGTAYGHCRMLHQAGTDRLAWVICTIHDASSEQAPTPDGALQAGWDCPACHHVPFVDPVPTPLPSCQPVVWHPVAEPAAPSAVATLGPRAPPPPARGPPHHA